MIPNDILLFSYIITQLRIFFSETLHPATDGSRFRDPQPQMRQTSGNPVGDGEEGLSEPEDPRTTRENTQSTDQGSWELMKTKMPTRELVWDQHGSSAYVLQLCGLVFFWDS